MKPKIYVDGEHGTTGLQIVQRLEGRGDIELLSIPAERRRDRDLRTELLRAADIAILCLPDDGAREAVSLAEGASTRFIDASTAHRTDADWVFGFAEMDRDQPQRIAAAKRVSNPGCYSTGAIALLRPLTAAGLLPRDYPVTINAVSGYTGGGKSLIARFEEKDHPDAIAAPTYLYGLSLSHKHVPEIMQHGGLSRRPIFTPNVGRFPQGMTVQIPLHLDLMQGGSKPRDLHAALGDHYAGQDVVELVDYDEAAKLEMVTPTDLAGTDRMQLYVFASKDGAHANLVATLDNLGKGASGAAVQNLDLMIGRR